MRTTYPDDPAKRSEMMREAYEKMHQALLKTRRPIVYSLCQYGYDSVWEWGPKVGANLWRTTADISPSYDRMTLLALMQDGLESYSGPGHWNDPDMLEVGNGKLSHNENVTHMTMWAMLAAPLIAGNNLTQMNPDVLQNLTNNGVIAIDQDPLGLQARRVAAKGEVQIWERPLADGRHALALFNFGSDRALMRDLDIPMHDMGYNKSVLGKDVWSGQDVEVNTSMKQVIPPHGAILIRLPKP